MKDEMTGWKARTHDLVRKIEKMSPHPDKDREASIVEM